MNVNRNRSFWRATVLITALLSVGSAGLWFRGLIVRDVFIWLFDHPAAELKLMNGGEAMRLSLATYGSAHQMGRGIPGGADNHRVVFHHRVGDYSQGIPIDCPVHELGGIKVWHDAWRSEFGVILPHSIITAICLVTLLGALAILRRRSHSTAPGTCAHCGYDLRASVSQCLECGSPIVVAEKGTAVLEHFDGGKL